MIAKTGRITAIENMNASLPSRLYGTSTTEVQFSHNVMILRVVS